MSIQGSKDGTQQNLGHGQESFQLENSTGIIRQVIEEPHKTVMGRGMNVVCFV